MATGLSSQIGREDLREQLCNLLRLLEHSGTKEIMLTGGQLLGNVPSDVSADADGLVGDGGMEEISMGEAAAGARAMCGGRPVGDGSPEAEAAVGAEGGLGRVRREVGTCTMCHLHKGRTNTVLGEGNASARLMFVGEGPGADEDLQGRPFVGRAGMLLTKIIEAMGLRREDVYIGNIVKCRTPGNRVPEPDEIAACLPYLEKQIELVKPQVICTLGNVATQTITGERAPISGMRGKMYDYRGVKVIPTFHPAACLRNPAYKKLVWEDIKNVMKVLDLPIRGVIINGPGKNRN
jgi:DNA polymerase